MVDALGWSDSIASEATSSPSYLRQLRGPGGREKGVRLALVRRKEDDVENLVIQVPEQDQPRWLRESVSRLQQLFALPQGWDSYRAKRVNPAVAEPTLRLLAELMSDASPLPNFVATKAGGVQLEWHRNGCDLEIEVRPGRKLYLYFAGPQSDAPWEGEVSAASPTLLKYANRILAVE